MARYYRDLNPFSPVQEEQFKQAMETNPLQSWEQTSDLFTEADTSGLEAPMPLSLEEQAAREEEEAGRLLSARKAERERRELEKERKQADAWGNVQDALGEERPEPEAYDVSEDPYDVDHLLAKATGEEAPEEMEFSERESELDKDPAEDMEVLDPYDPTNLSEDEAERQRLSGLSDEELALETYELEQKKKQEATALERKRLADEQEALEADREEYEKGHQRSVDRSEKLLAEMEELSQKEVDPERWASNLGAGRAIALGIAALADSQLALKQGRGNQALASMEKMIERDIEAQVQNLRHARGMLQDRQGVVGELYAKHKDLTLAKTAARDALYANIEKQNAAKMAAMDPKGTQFREREMFRRQIVAKREANKAEALAAMRKEEREDAKVRNEMRQTDLKFAQEERAMDKDARDAVSWDAKARGVKKFKPTYDPETGRPTGYEAVQGRGAPKLQEKELEFYYGVPPGTFQGFGPMSLKQAEKVLAARKKYGPGQVKPLTVKEQADTEKSVSEAKLAKQKAAKGLVVMSPGDRKPLFEAVDTDQAKEINAQLGLTQEISDLVDSVDAMRKEGGGANSVVKSAEFQRLKAAVEAIDMKNAVNLGLGAISKDDKNNLVNYRGGVEPEDFLRDAMPGLKAMRDNMVNGANIKLNSAQYRGDRWKPTRKHYHKALETPTPEVLANIQAPIPALIKGTEREKDYIANKAAEAKVLGSKHRLGGRVPGRDLADVVDTTLTDLPRSQRIDVLAPAIAGNTSMVAQAESIRSVLGVPKKMSSAQRDELAKDREFMKDFKRLEDKLREGGYKRDIHLLIFGKKKGAK